MSKEVNVTFVDSFVEYSFRKLGTLILELDVVWEIIRAQTGPMQ